MADNTVQNLREVIVYGKETFDTATEIIEGTTPQDVTLRDGTTRPNWEKRLRQLLADIQIFSDPTAGNNAVSDGAFFGVGSTDSNGVTSIDIYQRIDGSPVKRLNTSEAAIASATDNVPGNGVGVSRQLSAYTLTNGYRNWVNDDEQPGDIESAGDSVTDLIHVFEGEAYCLSYSYDSTLSTRSYNLIAFYDSNKQPVGSLIHSDWSNAATESELKILEQQDMPDRGLRKYVVIPQDGYIKISMPNRLTGSTLLTRVDKQTFIDNHWWFIGSQNLATFDQLGQLKSPIYEKLGYAYVNGSGGWTLQSSNPSAVSQLVPVKTGQWVTAICPSYNSAANFLFFNEQKQITTVENFYKSASARLANGEGYKTVENYYIAQDGYVAIQKSTSRLGMADAGLIFVTDDRIRLDYPWLISGQFAQRLAGNSNSTNPGEVYTETSGVDSFRHVHIQQGTGVYFEYQHWDASYIPVSAFVVDEATDKNNTRWTRVPVLNHPENGIAKTGKTYKAMLFADKFDVHVAINTAAGTGLVEALDVEAFKNRRDELLTEVIPKTNTLFGTTFPYGYQAASNQQNRSAIAPVPLLPGEVLVVKTNTLAMNLPQINYLPQDSGFQRNATQIPYRNQGSFIANNAFRRYFHNTDGVVYASADIVTDSPETWLEDGDLQVIDEDEFLSTYFDGEAVPNGTITDFLFETTWDSQDKMTGMAINTTAFSHGNYSTMAPFFVHKGQCYQWHANADANVNRRTPFVIYYDDETQQQYAKALTDCGPQPEDNSWVSIQPMGGYFKAEADGWVYLQSRTLGSNEEVNSNNKLAIQASDKLDIHLVSEETYRRNADITFTDRCLYIPDAKGLVFKMINGPMPYDRNDYEYSYPCQVWKDGIHLTTFELRTAVQGQASASASASKLNIDVKGRNADGKKMKFKIGTWKETNKLVLKAGSGGDVQRDVIACEYWRMIRGGDRSYPDNIILDPHVLDLEDDYPEFGLCQDAVASTQGVPALVEYGDIPWGLFALRTKKDEPNYGIVEDDDRMIWLQSDYRWDYANGNSWMIDWTAFKWQYWEVTQPEEDGYSVGQTPTNTTVLDQVPRVMNWIAGCLNGDDGHDFDNQADDYLYLPSWIDYLIHGELVANDDGRTNNIIMACHDTQADNPRWSIYAYDLDMSMGASRAASYSKAYMSESASKCGVWYLLMQSAKYKPQVIERYQALRKGALSESALLSQIDDFAKAVPQRWRDDDSQFWGHTDRESLTSMKGWIVNRLAWLDDYFKEDSE